VRVATPRHQLFRIGATFAFKSNKLQHKLRPGFKYKFPGFKCRNEAVKSGKLLKIKKCQSGIYLLRDTLASNKIKGNDVCGHPPDERVIQSASELLHTYYVQEQTIRIDALITAVLVEAYDRASQNP
jgi:uncharacterized protein with FMN-binding domain